MAYISSVGVLCDRAGILVTAGKHCINQHFCSILSLTHVFKIFLLVKGRLDQPAVSAVGLLVAEELDAEALPVGALQLPVRAHLNTEIQI